MTLLDKLSRAQLQALVEEIAASYPRLVEEIAGQIERTKWGKKP